MAKELTDDDVKLVIHLYLNTNLTMLEISNKVGRKSKDFIYKILKENNIPKRRSVKRKIPKSEEKHIINMYERGKTLSDISKIYDVSSGTIKLILNDNNIELRSNRKHYVNESYFKSIDNQNKAYILGFIFADGHIREDNLVLSIVVHNKDIDILKKIKKELDSSAEIEYIENKNHNRLNICSKNICESLNRLGCHNKKTFDLKFPNIDNDLIPHFIRGFMDGDGCISISSKKYGKYISLSFVGTKDMMHSLKDILNVDNKVTFYRNAYALHIGKESDVIRILDWIYKDANIYLDRKYKKYLEFKEYKHNGRG